MGLKEMFKSIDTDNNGMITLDELKAGLPKLGTKLSESEVMQYMEAVGYGVSNLLFFCFCNNWIVSFDQADVDGNGSVDYMEFISATMHMNRMEREEHLYKAFEYFDGDRSGWVHCCLL